MTVPPDADRPGHQSEYERLLKRTEQLQAEHDALRLKKPFRLVEHQEHSARLRQHEADLVAFLDRRKSGK